MEVPLAAGALSHHRSFPVVLSSFTLFESVLTCFHAFCDRLIMLWAKLWAHWSSAYQTNEAIAICHGHPSQSLRVCAAHKLCSCIHISVSQISTSSGNPWSKSDSLQQLIRFSLRRSSPGSGALENISLLSSPLSQRSLPFLSKTFLPSPAQSSFTRRHTTDQHMFCLVDLPGTLTRLAPSFLPCPQSFSIHLSGLSWYYSFVCDNFHYNHKSICLIP